MRAAAVALGVGAAAVLAVAAPARTQDTVRLAGALLIAALLAGCGGGEAPDAYGNFETTEVVVSAEASGRLLRFQVDEGDRLSAGAVVGLVDTTALALRLRELRAQRAAAHAQTGHATAQVGALEAELATARSELERTRRLYAEQAATTQRLDQARGRVEVLEARLRGARQQTTGSAEQAAALAARIAQLRERIDRSHVANPLAGTVLATYAEAGEYVRPGQPLYRIASLDTLVLRAYIGEAQLSMIRIGAPVQVRVDRGDTLLTRRGIVSWIAAEAEFTPTPIQTRDARTDLVYAVKIRVPNPDGVLKVGMPADVSFAAGGEA